MLIHAKTLLGLPIIESVMGREVGFVGNIIVDPDNGAVLGFLLKKPFMGKNRIIMFRDIREIFINGMTTASEENVIDLGEVIKVKEILDKGIFLLGSTVITQNDKRIGNLIDFIFDTSFSTMMTLMVKKTFSQEKRIISAERILNILPGKIVIRDAGSKVSVSNRSKILEPILPV